MGRMVSVYATVQIVILVGLVCIAIITIFLSRRYLKNHGSKIPPGFEKTEEISIEPKDGKRLRVYFNNQTGERFYLEEK